jgi:hypothetical protein
VEINIRVRDQEDFVRVKERGNRKRSGKEETVSQALIALMP